jgi:signal transduction histidine kinase
VSAAVYFCCLEAIQNVLVHAPSATFIDIDVGYRDGEVWFAVTDDGPGFDPVLAAGGRGFVNMRDRLTAFGGRVDVEFPPGGGTRVWGSARVAPLEH